MGFLNKIKSMVSTEKDYDDGVYPVSDDSDYAEKKITGGKDRVLRLELVCEHITGKKTEER